MVLIITSYPKAVNACEYRSANRVCSVSTCQVTSDSKSDARHNDKVTPNRPQNPTHMISVGSNGVTILKPIDSQK